VNIPSIKFEFDLKKSTHHPLLLVCTSNKHTLGKCQTYRKFTYWGNLRERGCGLN